MTRKKSFIEITEPNTVIQNKHIYSDSDGNMHMTTQEKSSLLECPMCSDVPMEQPVIHDEEELVYHFRRCHIKDDLVCHWAWFLTHPSKEKGCLK